MPEPTRPRAALLNADRLDFDGRLSFADLEQVVELIRHQATEPEQVIERASGCQVLISKEMPLPAEVIEGLPEEVRLICEAGTGHDNVDLAAAQRRGHRGVQRPRLQHRRGGAADDVLRADAEQKGSIG